MYYNEIQKRAYYIHLKYPENSSKQNWYLAEYQIQTEKNINKLENSYDKLLQTSSIISSKIKYINNKLDSYN
jgi:hypothetical protein